MRPAQPLPQARIIDQNPLPPLQDLLAILGQPDKTVPAHDEMDLQILLKLADRR